MKWRQAIYQMQFKILIIRMHNELRERIDELSENFKKEIENIKKNQSEMKNTITEIYNILGAINSRLDEKKD